MKSRKMTIDDIDGVLEIEKRSFSVPWTGEAFLGEINNKFAIYVVLEVEGKIIAYGGMWKVLDEGHITNIAVHPDERGLGYGDKIVEALIEAARGEEIDRMTLEVRKSNVAAQNLYKKYGFDDCGVRPKYYEDNHEDAIIMWKEKI